MARLEQRLDRLEADNTRPRLDRLPSGEPAAEPPHRAS